jgi:hypothetical protein
MTSCGLSPRRSREPERRGFREKVVDIWREKDYKIGQDVVADL